MQTYNQKLRLGGMTVGELDGSMGHSLLLVMKWLLLMLGLPVAASCALGVLYFVVPA